MGSHTGKCAKPIQDEEERKLPVVKNWVSAIVVSGSLTIQQNKERLH
jgi:hypothetical protein